MYIKGREQEEIKQQIPSEIAKLFADFDHYTIQAIKLNETRKDLLYEMTNVKAVDNTKQKFAYDKERAINSYYSKSDRLEDIENELIIYKTYLKGIKQLLDKIKSKELKDSIYKAYINNAKELADYYSFKI